MKGRVLLAAAIVVALVVVSACEDRDGPTSPSYAGSFYQVVGVEELGTAQAERKGNQNKGLGHEIVTVNHGPIQPGASGPLTTFCPTGKIVVGGGLNVAGFDAW